MTAALLALLLAAQLPPGAGCVEATAKVSWPLEEPAQDSRLAEPLKKGGRCEVADSNLREVEDAILAGKGRLEPVKGAKAGQEPKHLAEVTRRLALTAAERDVLKRNGFVVPARLAFDSYGWAFHEIYQSQLPLYVSADAIFHAVYLENDALIARIERTQLGPRLAQVLAKLHCALPGGLPTETARDVDLYLTVARALLAGAPVGSVLGVDAEAKALVVRAVEAKGMEEVALFGRQRMIDFTAYSPRGHYGEDLAGFFRAAMWLSRLELNLVSRSCRSSSPTLDPSPTPREALIALGLEELAARTGALPELAALDRAWALLAGKREDVSLGELAALRQKANLTTLDASAPQKLTAAIGDGFQRSARLHYMPEGAGILPVIATLLGPRVVADTQAARQLGHPAVPEHYLVGMPELAYALGQDRALEYLKDDLQKFPKLRAQLDVSRKLLQAPVEGADLYSAWLAAIRGLGEPLQGAHPTFMDSAAFQDLRLNSTVAAFGQLRHNYVLIAGQGYDEGGCEIPDGYVEPAPAAYDGLIAYADRGARAMAELDPKDPAGAVAYFGRLGKVLRVLRMIMQDELEGRPLSHDQKRFLSMVVEMSPGGTGGPPTYTGWYFDLFAERLRALNGTDFIADFFTSSYLQQISYAGATAPLMGAFIVDASGPPRAMAGPVARAFMHTGPLEKRLADADAKLPVHGEPWAKSYTVAAAKEPDLRVSFPANDDPRGVEVEGVSPGVEITLEVLDHHRVPVASKKVKAGAKVKIVKFPKLKRDLEGLLVKVGDWSVLLLPGMGPTEGRYGALRRTEE